MGKTSVLDILGINDSSCLSVNSPSSKRKAPSNSGMDIVVYDDNSMVQDLSDSPQDNILCTVLTSLLRDGNDVHVLEGKNIFFIIIVRMNLLLFLYDKEFLSCVLFYCKDELVTVPA